MTKFKKFKKQRNVLKQYILSEDDSIINFVSMINWLLVSADILIEYIKIIFKHKFIL